MQQNRPYSCINVFENLKGEVKKAQCTKILDQLTQEKKLICKEYNTKIYLPNQDLFEKVDMEELNKMDVILDQQKKEKQDLIEENKKLQSILRQINSTFTNSQLIDEIKRQKEIVIY